MNISRNLTEKICDLKRYLFSISENYSPSQVKMAEVKRLITDLSSFQECQMPKHDMAKFVKCLVSYISIVLEYNYLNPRRSTRAHIEMLRNCFEPIPAVLVAVELKNVFVLNATEELLNVFLLETHDFWCKSQLLKTYIDCIKESDLEARGEAGEKQQMELYRLLDALEVTCDFETQSNIIKIIFLIYTNHIRSNKDTRFVQLHPTIYKFFTVGVTADNFDVDVQEFLNEYNKEKNSLFSVPCKHVSFGNSLQCEPLRSLDVIWVHFNLQPKTVTWYCKRTSIMGNPIENDKTIGIFIRLFESGVKSVSIKRTIEHVMMLEIVYNESCLSNKLETQRFLDKARRKLNLVVNNYYRDSRLISTVLPCMFGTKFKVRTSAKFTNGDETPTEKSSESSNVAPGKCCNVLASSGFSENEVISIPESESNTVKLENSSQTPEHIDSPSFQFEPVFKLHNNECFSDSETHSTKRTPQQTFHQIINTSLQEPVFSSSRKYTSLDDQKLFTASQPSQISQDIQKNTSCLSSSKTSSNASTGDILETATGSTEIRARELGQSKPIFRECDVQTQGLALTTKNAENYEDVNNEGLRKLNQVLFTSVRQSIQLERDVNSKSQSPNLINRASQISKDSSLIAPVLSKVISNYECSCSPGGREEVAQKYQMSSNEQLYQSKTKYIRRKRVALKSEIAVPQKLVCTASSEKPTTEVRNTGALRKTHHSYCSQKILNVEENLKPMSLMFKKQLVVRISQKDMENADHHWELIQRREFLKASRKIHVNLNLAAKDVHMLHKGIEEGFSPVREFSNCEIARKKGLVTEDNCLEAKNKSDDIQTVANCSSSIQHKGRVFNTTTLSISSSRRRRKLYDPSDLTYLENIEELDVEENERVRDIEQARKRIHTTRFEQIDEIVSNKDVNGTADRSNRNVGNISKRTEKRQWTDEEPIKVYVPKKPSVKNKRAVADKKSTRAAQHGSGPRYTYKESKANIYFYTKDIETGQRVLNKVPKGGIQFDFDETLYDLGRKMRYKEVEKDRPQIKKRKLNYEKTSQEETRTKRTKENSSKSQLSMKDLLPRGATNTIDLDELIEITHMEPLKKRMLNKSVLKTPPLGGKLFAHLDKEGTPVVETMTRDTPGLFSNTDIDSPLPELDVEVEPDELKKRRPKMAEVDYIKIPEGTKQYSLKNQLSMKDLLPRGATKAMYLDELIEITDTESLEKRMLNKLVLETPPLRRKLLERLDKEDPPVVENMTPKNAPGLFSNTNIVSPLPELDVEVEPDEFRMRKLKSPEIDYIKIPERIGKIRPPLNVISNILIEPVQPIKRLGNEKKNNNDICDIGQDDVLKQRCMKYNRDEIEHWVETGNIF